MVKKANKFEPWTENQFSHLPYTPTVNDWSEILAEVIPEKPFQGVFYPMTGNVDTLSYHMTYEYRVTFDSSIGGKIFCKVTEEALYQYIMETNYPPLQALTRLAIKAAVKEGWHPVAGSANHFVTPQIEIQPGEDYPDTLSWDPTAWSQPKPLSLEEMTLLINKITPEVGSSPQVVETPLEPLMMTLPGLMILKPCPESNCPDYPPMQGSLGIIIIHLNDKHLWTREAIADWLETLDVDLTFPDPTSDEEDLVV